MTDNGEHLTADQRMQRGRELRQKVPRNDHAIWDPPSDRRDPVDVLLDTEKSRLPELLPIRHGRMMVSPLTYLRGAAAMMAYDLSHTPTSGIGVQACGDCHLGNFGFFATPARHIAFDINDFDETLPAPWEWDLKRLAASFFVAGQNNGFSDKACLGLVRICAQSYREMMRELSTMNVMDMWYFELNTDLILSRVKDEVGAKMVESAARKARRNIATYVYPKITSEESGHRQIKDDPPLIFHITNKRSWPDVRELFEKYRESLPHERRVLLDRYHFEDFALKVVGVGSVGTRCGIALMLAEPFDPLLLQVKEAASSVLEPYAGRSAYDHQGQRVVVGQRIIQTNSDIMLGWVTVNKTDFYVRQLKDMKYAFEYLEADLDGLSRYARLCGTALAKAHSRSGDSAMIAGYLGKSDAFDRAMASFAQQYAKQNDDDYRVMVDAVKEGRLQAIEGK